MNRRQLLFFGAAASASIIPNIANARAYGVNGYATRRNREYNRAIEVKNDITLAGYKAFEAGETTNPWIDKENVRWEPYAFYWDTGWLAAKDFNALPKQEQERIIAERKEEVEEYLRLVEKRRIDEEKERQDRDFWFKVQTGAIFIPIGIMALSLLGYAIYIVGAEKR